MRTRWLITDKGDPDARRLVDGELPGLTSPHYSRQQPGTLQFTRNGQNLVFITRDGRAAWVTFRPTPGKAKRPDGLQVWECALFRNESPYLSSELIVEAEELSAALWGRLPPEGFITFIKPDKVKPKAHPGYCYMKAGWSMIPPTPGALKKGYLMFGAPQRPDPRPLSRWRWKEGRGGRLRRALVECADLLE